MPLRQRRPALDTTVARAGAADAHDRYRSLVELSPDGIFIAEDSRIVFLNPAAVRLFGASTAEQVIGRALFDMFHRDRHEQMRERMRRLLAGHAAPLVEQQIVRLDGQVIDVEVTAALLDQDPPAVQVIVRDLTERKRTENALRESEERLTLAFAGAQEGVYDWNIETGAVFYSPRWTEMLGYTPEEIEPHVRTWERLLHPDDSDLARGVLERVMRGEQDYRLEFRIRHKDGHYVDILSRGYAVRRTPDGPVVRIVGTHFDLTERKRAEAALRESEERLRLAFAGAQEGVWDWNLETGGVVYSTQWKQMLGYNDEEIEPHVSAWERLLHPEDVVRARQVHERVARGGRLYEGEFRLRHRAGHYIHVLSRGFPVRRVSGGPVVRIVGTHFDLTERKRSEAMLRRAHEELEVRVRERTAELARANASLRAEMEERERAERARMDLLSRLVFAQEDERRRIAREMHDQFGEQLTALGRHIGLLEQACASQPALAEQVNALEQVARRLDRDVDHLVWQLRPTALDDLGLRAALANYVQDWSKRVNIAAELHTCGLLDDRLPSDAETTLFRIAQEALTNIAKHACATSVEIILERRPDHVLLIVEDNGIGFEPGASRQGPHGFGLLGMQERAALVGATLQIESAVNEGTTILLRMATPAAPGSAAGHV
jgi:PAS domain S-box-containing protein